MSTISAAEVKKLRDLTGAGMMECKAALTEANGNIDEATTILRKKGLATAAKKAGRTASEGLIANMTAADHSSGIIAEVNCESDFVARTEDFKTVMAEVLKAVDAAGDAASVEWLKEASNPVQQLIAATIAKLGENIVVPRFVRYAGQGYVGQYIHMGGKIGVQLEFAGVTPEIAGREEFVAMVKEVAMQIAAASPAYATREGVPADILEREKDIYRAQMEGQNKPAAVIEKIVAGKLGSFYEQVVLIDQPSIREPKMKVSDVIAAANKTLGASVSVTRFVRFKVGETL